MAAYPRTRRRNVPRGAIAGLTALAAALAFVALLQLWTDRRTQRATAGE